MVLLILFCTCKKSEIIISGRIFFFFFFSFIFDRWLVPTHCSYNITTVNNVDMCFIAHFVTFGWFFNSLLQKKKKKKYILRSKKKKWDQIIYFFAFFFFALKLKWNVLCLPNSFWCLVKCCSSRFTKLNANQRLKFQQAKIHLHTTKKKIKPMCFSVDFPYCPIISTVFSRYQ